MVSDGPAAHLAAAPEPRVEALEQLGVELPRGEPAEGRADVQAEETFVALPRRRLELGDLEPLLNNLADRDGAPRVPLLVDLAEELGELDLRELARRGRLAEVALPARERVDTGIDHRSEGAVAAVLGVPTRTVLRTSYEPQVDPTGRSSPRSFPSLGR